MKYEINRYSEFNIFINWNANKTCFLMVVIFIYFFLFVFFLGDTLRKRFQNDCFKTSERISCKNDTKMKDGILLIAYAGQYKQAPHWAAACKVTPRPPAPPTPLICVPVRTRRPFNQTWLPRHVGHGWASLAHRLVMPTGFKAEGALRAHTRTSSASPIVQFAQ